MTISGVESPGSIDTRELIDTSCREFTRATGWRLEFVFCPEDSSPELLEEGIRADGGCYWFAPMDDGARTFGFLTLRASEDERPADELSSVCDFAEILAGLCSRLATGRQALQQHEHEVTTLVEIGRHIHRDGSLPTILNQLLAAAVHLTDFRGAAFFGLNASAAELHCRSINGVDTDSLPHLNRPLCDEPPDLNALLDGQIRLHSRVESERGWLPSVMSTGLCVRVESESAPLGTLWLYDRRDRVPTERELHVIESIVAQLAGSMERAMLQHESSEQRRLQELIEVAAYNQACVHVAERPLDPRCDLSTLCLSHDELGGDLCEIVSIDEHRTVIAVGDATGHSVPAAMIMASVRGCVRTLLDNGLSDVEQTGRVLSQINKALYRVTPEHLFMSMIFGVFDTKAQRFVYSNAGHPVPLHYRRGEFERLVSHGILLGVLPSVEYEQSEVAIAPGDLLVAFTDGITEARDQSRALFRTDGVASAFDPQQCPTARDVVEAIMKNLDGHTGGGQEDDRTLVVARFAG